MRSILKQAEQWPFRAGATTTPRKVYRGLKVDLPPDLEQAYRRYLQMPENESETDQHLNIGPMLLDYMERSNSIANTVPGIGPHWTDSLHFAQHAALTQGSPQGYPVVVEADHPGDQHIDPHGSQMVSERESSFLPGTPMNVTGVHVRSPFDSGWLNTLAAPHTRKAARGAS